MNLEVFADAQSLAQGAAEFILGQAREAVTVRQRFNLVLSGGSTPLAAYQILGSPWGREMPWADVRVFWGDERCVPASSSLSNQGAALSSLGRPPGLRQEHLHPIPAHLGARDGALAYESGLRRYFQGRAWPVFDLVLLGVGEDGHTASIFPTSPLLKEKAAWVAPVAVPHHVEPQVKRITLTLPAISAARRILVLAAGAAKKHVVSALRQDPDQAALQYPAAMVSAAGGVTWFVDRAAAGE